MNFFKLLFFVVFTVVVSCKKEIATTKNKHNSETVTTKSISDSTTAKSEEKVVDLTVIEVSNKIEEVVDVQESKTNHSSTSKVDKEAVSKIVNDTEDSKEVEIIESANTQQEEKVNLPVIKEKIVPKQNPILKAGTEHINAVEFKEKIEGNNVQLIDVRTPKEFTHEHIKGAININYYKKELFKNEMAKLDKSKPVYVYCRSGVRSNKSAKILKNAGYKVYDLKGGILNWKNNNLGTVK